MSIVPQNEYYARANATPMSLCKHQKYSVLKMSDGDFLREGVDIVTFQSLAQWVYNISLAELWISAVSTNAYLITLMEKVKSHAIKAMSRTDAKPFCRAQIPSLSRREAVQTGLLRVSKARLRFAESKTMKKRSRKMRRIFALAGRKPRGFPEYSS